jgi:hypothetical protein
VSAYPTLEPEKAKLFIEDKRRKNEEEKRKRKKKRKKTKQPMLYFYRKCYKNPLYVLYKKFGVFGRGREKLKGIYRAFYKRMPRFYYPDDVVLRRLRSKFERD